MAEPQTKKQAAARKAGEPPPKFITLLPRDLNIDFVGKRKFFLVLSTILNLAAVALFLTRGFNYGVDFTGGTPSGFASRSRRMPRRSARICPI
jgi:preprotein translocase subunit SecF